MKKETAESQRKNQKLKNSKLSKVQKFFAISIPTLCSIIILSIILIAILTNRTTIAFYNIPQNQQNAISKIIQSNFPKKIKIISLNDDFDIQLSNSNSGQTQSNDTQNLTKQLQKAKLIIAIKDSEIENYIKTQTKIVPFEAELLKGMPQSISETVPVHNNHIKYLPLLFDMYQIDINYNFFLDSAIKNITIFQDLDNFADNLKSKVYAPIVLPFADSKEFLNIFGQMLEALTNPQEYQNFYNQLQKIYNTNKNDNKKLTQELENFLQQQTQDNSTAFSKTQICFKHLINDKKIKDIVISQNLEENLYYLDNQICGIFFTKLSDHRKIDRQVINNYKSIYFPSTQITDNRKFCAYQYTAIVQTKNKHIQTLAQNLSNSLQKELSTQTGLSPVQKNCQVPDHQSDDVRYWLAASKGPLPPLTCAIPSLQIQNQVSSYIKNQLTQ